MRENIKATNLSTRLWHLARARNKFAAIPHFAVMGLACLTHPSFLAAQLSHFVPLILVALGCLLRIFLFFFFVPDKLPKLWIRLNYHLSLFLIGLGWALFAQESMGFYGHYSQQVLLVVFMMAGLVSAAMPANAAVPSGYIMIIAPLILIPSFQLLFRPTVELFIYTGSIAFYSFFNLFQLKISYSYITQFLEKDFEVTLQRDKLQTLINAVPGFVGFIDEELTYLSINDFGLCALELRNHMGKTIQQVHPDTDYSRFVQNFMQSEKITSTGEISIPVGESTSTFIISIKKIFEPHGGAVIVGLPINELIEVRETLRAQEAKALYSAKLTSLGEFAAGIAHEINNPLAIILGSSDQMVRVLKRTEVDTAKLQMHTEKIQKMVERIALIIRSLRVLTRNGEKDPLMPLNLNSIIEPSIEISRQRFKEEQVQLEVQLPENSVYCPGQEIQLSQVIMNLLNNAFDAASEGPSPRWVRLKVNPNQQEVDIIVEDSGHGIPKEIRGKIMEPFFTTKDINKGTGLGLSISKSIVEYHGGTLFLDEEAPFTTFVVRLKQTT